MLISQGKTKNLYKDEGDEYYFIFKDQLTGRDGLIDPGADQVIGEVEGSGKASLIMSSYYFQLLDKAGIANHFISSSISENKMSIKMAQVFGQGLEVICRYRAVGSFVRRYGLYVDEGARLDAYVEFTLKDDQRQDPLINQDALEELGILKEGDYDQLRDLTKTISALVREDLSGKGLELYDIKLEYGRLAGQDEIILIDEISANNMRVYKDGRHLQGLDLINYFN